MAIMEVEFEILDYVQTIDGKTFTIGLRDNLTQKTVSIETAHLMHQQRQLLKKSEVVEGETVFEDLALPNQTINDLA